MTRRFFLKVSLTLAALACVGVGAAPPTRAQDGAQRKCSRGNFLPIEGLTIRRVEYNGDTYIPDNVIRRRLMVNEGDPFSLSRMRKGLAKVYRLGVVEKLRDDDIEWCLDEKTQEVDFVFNFTETPAAHEKLKSGYWKRHK